MALSVRKALGDYSSEVHLFPFRTEKLSSLAQMVLLYQAEEYVIAYLYFKCPNQKSGWGFFIGMK